MPRPYSVDLRERVLQACEQGEGSRAEIARRFRVSERSVYNWLRLARGEGRRCAKPHQGGRRSALAAENGAVLRALHARRNDATLAEYAAWYQAQTGHPISLSAVCRALQRLGLVRKKRRSGPPSRTGRRSPRNGRPSAPSSPASIRPAWSSSTRPAS